MHKMGAVSSTPGSAAVSTKLAQALIAERNKKK
jgi:hypothetical protein